MTVIIQHNDAVAPFSALLTESIIKLIYSFFSCDFILCPCSSLVKYKFDSLHSYFSIMFHNDLSDQGNYLGSWAIGVKDKTRRDLSASD